MKIKQEEQEKRPYKKPELMQVPLRPEGGRAGELQDVWWRARPWAGHL